jgi:hypothetical protein
MFGYFFIISFLYCLVPCDFTAFMWLIAAIIGGVIMNRKEHHAD